jgi:hypothetical protein
MIRRSLARLVLIPLGAILGAVISLLVVATLGLERFTHEMHRQGGEGGLVELIFSAVLNWDRMLSLTAASVVLPALLVIIIGEIARIRSSVYYICGGGAALAMIPIMAGLERTGQVNWPAAPVWQVLATAGFAGGFVYWLVAGRTA